MVLEMRYLWILTHFYFTFVCLHVFVCLFFAWFVFEQLEEDKTFQEFLVVHQKRSQVATWANDALAEEPKKEKSKPVADYLNFDSDESEDLSEEEKDGRESSEDEKETKGTKMDYQPLLRFVLVNVRAGMLMGLDSVSCLETESVIRMVLSPAHNSLCAL